jgi:ATP-dependent Clp protease ATP-binding subunit ClpA
MLIDRALAASVDFLEIDGTGRTPAQVPIPGDTGPEEKSTVSDELELVASVRVPTPRYRSVLESASSLARQMGHAHVGVEHLFLAIIRDPHAIPTIQLAAVTDITEVENRILGVMNSESYYTTAPPPAGE